MEEAQGQNSGDSEFSRDLAGTNDSDPLANVTPIQYTAIPGPASSPDSGRTRREWGHKLASKVGHHIYLKH